MQGLARTARSLVKAAAPCGAGGSTPPGGPGRCSRIAKKGNFAANLGSGWKAYNDKLCAFAVQGK